MPAPPVEQADVVAAAAAKFTRPSMRAVADRYLASRGIDSHHLNSRWVVGYAPPRWTSLVDCLSGEFSAATLVDVGVATLTSRGHLIDAFRNRVMLGLHDAEGTLVGFIGRDVSGRCDVPKYLNSRQSLIFDKSAVLFGEHEQSQTAPPRQITIVEGPLDVLAIATAAADLHPLAACGTAMSAAQAKRIGVLSKTAETPVVLALDGDAAGSDATHHALERLLPVVNDVRIAALNTGEDPASVLVSAPSDAARFRASNASTVIDYLLRDAVTAQGDRMQWVEGRIAALRRVSTLATAGRTLPTAADVANVADVLGLAQSTVRRELVQALAVSGPEL